MKRLLGNVEERSRCQICKKWMEVGEEVALTEFNWNGDWRFLPVHIFHPIRNHRQGGAS